MINKSRCAFLSVFCCLLTMAIFTKIDAHSDNPHSYSSLKQIKNLDPKVLKLGLTAYENAKKSGLDSQNILTIVDYSKPSYERRLWVINVKNKQLLFNDLVAHGKGSGNVKPTHFSNDSRTHTSSIGTFLTGKTYYGKHGYSLRLHGLEPRFNSKAFKRTIVMHKAWYVSDNFAKKYGRLGRSLGCFALDEKVSPKIIKTIKNGTILFVYYPDQTWLKHSKFLKPSDHKLSLA